MNTLDRLLSWQNLIFILPLTLSALLLALSSLRIGHSSHGGHGRHGAGTGGHAPAHGGASIGRTGHGPAASPAGASGAHGGHGAGRGPHTSGHGIQGHLKLHIGPKSAHSKSAHAQAKSGGVSLAQALLGLLGVGRAPLLLVLEVFFLSWGFSGYVANATRGVNGEITPTRLVPSLLIALAGGLVGARLAGVLMTRLMPPEETLIVSQEGLYGMTGTVTFPVSESAGRIHIYDEHGTLHDEMCRVAPDHPAIEKGRRALVVDRNAQGHLIVEDIAERR